MEVGMRKFAILLFIALFSIIPSFAYAETSGEEKLLNDLVALEEPYFLPSASASLLYVGHYLYVEGLITDNYNDFEQSRSQVIDYLNNTYSPYEITSPNYYSYWFYVTFCDEGEIPRESCATYPIVVRNKVPDNINSKMERLKYDTASNKLSIAGINTKNDADYYFALSEYYSLKYGLSVYRSFENTPGEYIPIDYSRITFTNSECETLLKKSFGINNQLSIELANLEKATYCGEDNDYTVELDFSESNASSQVAAQAKDFSNKLNSINTIQLDGFQLINAIVNERDYYSAWGTEEYSSEKKPFSARAANYSLDTKKLLDNKNINIITPETNNYGCGGFFPYWFCGGALLEEQNGIFYGGVKYKTIVAHKFYISESTEDTTDAYSKAVDDAITDYLSANEDDITVNYAGKITTRLLEDEDQLIEIDQYKVKLFNKEYYFAVEKNDEKSVPANFKSEDIDTEVSLETESSEVPFDSNIQVIRVSNTEHIDLINNLNLNAANVYDIDLYSEGSGEKIKKLKNGQFNFKISIPKELKNKTVLVYYISSTGEVEEIEAKTNGHFVEFNTNHLSEYMIGTTDEISEAILNNPNTSDNIRYLAIIMTLSFTLFIFLIKINNTSSSF